MSEKSQGMRITASGVVAAVVLIGVLVTLFFIAKGIFVILEWLAPILVIGALIINYRTVLKFLKFVYHLLIERTLLGLLALILTIVGFPVVAGYLFGKSILDRRMAVYLKERAEENTFVEYEEITDFDKPRLKEIEKQRRKS